MQQNESGLKRNLLILFIVTLTILSALLSIKIYDYFLWRSVINGPNGKYFKMLVNDGMPPPMQQMNWYPYTGAHVQQNVNYFGHIPLESTEFYEEMEYKTGKHGFFTDIDIDTVLPKPDNEFRIILIGGSSAQGWGAEYVKDMLYQSLERRLNEKLSEKNIKVKILNLAMAGSITYQNYLALNVWGHNFNPDLILSYSGGNDLLVPVLLGSDAPMAWSVMQAYAASMHKVTMKTNGEAANTKFSKWSKILPGIMFSTQIGNIVRFIDMSKLPHEVEAEYAFNRGMANLDRASEIATPLYIKSLQSIKRDFDGIPMMVVFQPIDFRMLPDTNQLGDEYAEMIQRTMESCKNYKNPDWYFVNMREYWNKNNLWSRGKLGNGLHLPTIFQEIVSIELTEKLVPIIISTREKQSVAKFKENYS